MQVRVLIIIYRKSYIRRTVKIYTILYTLFIITIMRNHAIIQVARA